MGMAGTSALVELGVDHIVVAPGAARRGPAGTGSVP
jgi:hypothetical protein